MKWWRNDYLLTLRGQKALRWQKLESQTHQQQRIKQQQKQQQLQLLSPSDAEKAPHFWCQRKMIGTRIMLQHKRQRRSTCCCMQLPHVIDYYRSPVLWKSKTPRAKGTQEVERTQFRNFLFYLSHFCFLAVPQIQIRSRIRFCFFYLFFRRVNASPMLSVNGCHRRDITHTSKSTMNQLKWLVLIQKHDIWKTKFGISHWHWRTETIVYPDFFFFINKSR